MELDKGKLSKLSKRVKGEPVDKDADDKGKNAPIGTVHAHYAGPDEGPFLCANCTHFARGGHCNHPDVIEDAKAGEGGLSIVDGKAAVSARGCCNYFRNK